MNCTAISAACQAGSTQIITLAVSMITVVIIVVIILIIIFRSKIQNIRPHIPFGLQGIPHDAEQFGKHTHSAEICSSSCELDGPFNPQQICGTKEGNDKYIPYDTIAVCKDIDESGGTISLCGVELMVPPGALTRKQQICISILWDCKTQPQLDKGQAILSPVVSCEPHGLKFHKAASLRLPHCAKNVEEDWMLEPLCSETNPSEEPSWGYMKDKIEVTTSYVKLEVNHFTLYTLSGTAAGQLSIKWVDLVAYVPSTTSRQFRVTVYCLNNYSHDDATDKKKMRQNELCMGGRQAHSAVPLGFHGDGNNLTMRLVHIHDDWHIARYCASTQEIHFECVWQAMCGNCTFVLECNGARDSMGCSIESHQLTHPDNKVTLVVADDIKFQDSGEADLNMLEGTFPRELASTLQKMLDPDLALNNNWVMLAEFMEKRPLDIHWMAFHYRQTSRSPTMSLLGDWVRERRTLAQFEACMTEIQRYDVLDEIQTWQKKFAINPDEHNDEGSDSVGPVDSIYLEMDCSSRCHESGEELHYGESLVQNIKTDMDSVITITPMPDVSINISNHPKCVISHGQCLPASIDSIGTGKYMNEADTSEITEQVDWQANNLGSLAQKESKYNSDIISVPTSNMPNMAADQLLCSTRAQSATWHKSAHTHGSYIQNLDTDPEHSSVSPGKELQTSPECLYAKGRVQFSGQMTTETSTNRSFLPEICHIL